MKILIYLVALLLVSDCYSSPIIGRLLRRRKLYRGSVTGGILGTILGGGGVNSQQTRTRSALSSAPDTTPAPAPIINVHVQNIYNKQNNKHINNNNQIDSINNNVVNSDVSVKQDINNNAISNEYNNKEINNRLVNNNYGGPYSEAPARRQGSEGVYQPVPRYDARDENEREQSYKSRDAVQAERERENFDVARGRVNYNS